MSGLRISSNRRFASVKAMKRAHALGIPILAMQELGEPEARTGYTLEDVTLASHGMKWRWRGAERITLERTKPWPPELPSIVYVPGVFDLLHGGHINLLWRAKQLGDVLVAGVVSDYGASAYKGRFPEENVQLRILRLDRLGFVDVVVMQQTTDPTPMLERFRPAKLVHGDDWSKLREGQASLERLGVEFVLLPYTEGVSTTQLRALPDEPKRQQNG